MNTRYFLTRIICVIFILPIVFSTAVPGYFGYGTISNDSALDFLDKIVREDSVEGIRNILTSVAYEKAYIDDEEAARALAAAEMVAAINGQSLSNLDAKMIEWAKKRTSDNSLELIILAIKSTKRVFAHSETKELMQEATKENRLYWNASISDLLGRLRSSANMMQARTR